MKHRFLPLFLLGMLGICSSLSAQYVYRPYDKAIGVRIGEPAGISGKIFISQLFAVEVCIGQGGGFYWRKNLTFEDTTNTHDTVVQKVFTGIKGWQLSTYLSNHTPINMIKTFYLYYGIGAQILYYGGPGTKISAVSAGVTVGKMKPFIIVSAGPVIGIDYTFEEIPLSLFLDALPVFEMVSDAPGTFHPGGGFGVRLTF